MSFNDTILTDGGYDRHSGWFKLKNDAKNREHWSRIIENAVTAQQQARGLTLPKRKKIITRCGMRRPLKKLPPHITTPTTTNIRTEFIRGKDLKTVHIES